MSQSKDSSPGAPLYRAVWRWHFYAGLLALPFLVMMAITGGAYLFKAELDHLIYRSMENVAPRSASFMPASQFVARVEADLNGRVLQFTPPTAPNRAVRLLVRGPTGEALTVFANPYDGTVTGSTPYGGVMQLVRKVHSLQKFGFWASCLIELTAGWTIVLVGTGLFLWWPRGQAIKDVVTVRGSPGQRVFWRDLHAVTGVLAGGIILFLAATGMPWSMFWGAHVQKWATAANLNEPAPPAAVTPEWAMTATMPNMPHAPHSSDAPIASEIPWAMQQTSAPMSHALPHAEGIGLDTAVDIFARLGVNRGADIALPDGPQGAYMATWRPDRVQDTRVVYLDQYSGAVLGDVGFKDWGPVAKAIEWGIQVHQGQEYGPVNRYVMLFGCLAILLASAAAVTMWWKRRPSGSLGAPPAVPARGVVRGFLAIMAIVGAVFPLVGVSILIAIAVDLTVCAIRTLRA